MVATYSCLGMNFATTHLRLSTWPTMNGFGMPYFQLCHCLATNGYRQQTARKRQQMIESYLSDADTTFEQKLPTIDQFFT